MFETKIIANNNSGRATEEEIKEICEFVDYKKALSDKEYRRIIKPFGFNTITDGNKAWASRDDGFALCIGSTGSKKTRCVVMPYIYNNMIQGNSLFIVDVKADIYKTMSKRLRKEGYRIVVINFNDPDRGDAYNPVKMAYEYYHSGKTGKALKCLNRIAKNIFEKVKSDKDAFWHTVSESLFVGQMLCLIKNFGIEMATIENAYNLYNQGLLKAENFISKDCIHEFYEDRKDSPEWLLMQSSLDAPSDTKSSIMAVYTAAMNECIGQNPELMKMLSHSTFEIEDMVEEKTAVFIIANEEALSVHSGLITVLLQNFYDKLAEEANKTNGVLKRRVNFILDEFGNYEVPDIDVKISLSRASGIHYMLVLQSFAQLNLRYSANVAKVIISNTNNWIFLNSPDLETMTHISKLCDSRIEEHTGKMKPLYSVSDLRTLQKFSDEEDGYTECLMLLNRTRPYLALLQDIGQYHGIEVLEGLDIPVREDPETEPLNFVKAVKEYKEEIIKKRIEEKIAKIEAAEKKLDKNSDKESDGNEDKDSDKKPGRNSNKNSRGNSDKKSDENSRGDSNEKTDRKASATFEKSSDRRIRVTTDKSSDKKTDGNSDKNSHQESSKYEELLDRVISNLNEEDGRKDA